MQLEKISFHQILPIWRDYLWPNRISEITPNSAMCFLEGYDLFNMQTPPTFFAYMIDGEIAGVNSGHMCKDNDYRSRGLYVFEKFRGRGLGTALLEATIKQAIVENASMCWSYPKDTSWKSYSRAGYRLASDFEISENGTNAYCIIDL
jgi:GNAT superfamily N-acetyltransferase